MSYRLKNVLWSLRILMRVQLVPTSNDVVTIMISSFDCGLNQIYKLSTLNIKFLIWYPLYEDDLNYLDLG